MLKVLYGASLGIMVFMMAFMAPSGRVFTTSASPDRVKQDTAGPSAHGSRGTRRTRNHYVFIGSFGK
tara:strand:+ start:1862 stop:2062 length:201 start_codon:yes stop_codon:yes gene_type:complete